MSHHETVNELSEWAKKMGIEKIAMARCVLACQLPGEFQFSGVIVPWPNVVQLEQEWHAHEDEYAVRKSGILEISLPVVVVAAPEGVCSDDWDATRILTKKVPQLRTVNRSKAETSEDYDKALAFNRAAYYVYQEAHPPKMRPFSKHEWQEADFC